MAAAEERKKKILFVGITGTGKSSFGNLVTNTNAFKVSDLAKSQTKKFAFASNASVEVFDTMGLCDTDDTPARTRTKIAEALRATGEGADLVVFFIKKDRFKDHEYAAFKFLVEAIFGTDVCKHLLLAVTFCGGKMVSDEADQQRWLECRNDLPTLKYVYDMCHSRVIFIENPELSDEPDQEVLNAKRRKASLENFYGVIDVVLNGLNGELFTPAMGRQARHEHDLAQKKLHQAEKKARTAAEREAVLAEQQKEQESYIEKLEHLVYDAAEKVKKSGLFSELGDKMDRLLGWLF